MKLSPMFVMGKRSVHEEAAWQEFMHITGGWPKGVGFSYVDEGYWYMLQREEHLPRKSVKHLMSISLDSPTLRQMKDVWAGRVTPQGWPTRDKV